ncbi:hypothetical protein WJX75_006927 [Coccomyxa subellipsoidea]|uniref:Uncharacterized protein n=1 Tax=Coccomyxa subellipsoidea TaxID=248742 RepID=A0ABR2YFQ0_9CHLO
MNAAPSAEIAIITTNAK